MINIALSPLYINVFDHLGSEIKVHFLFILSNRYIYIWLSGTGVLVYRLVLFRHILNMEHMSLGFGCNMMKITLFHSLNYEDVRYTMMMKANAASQRSSFSVPMLMLDLDKADLKI